MSDYQFRTTSANAAIRALLKRAREVEQERQREQTRLEEAQALARIERELRNMRRRLRYEANRLRRDSDA